MAQRRSRNRRLSARRSNVSGILNEDTNVYENANDPMWYDRTAIRPSTSLRLSKHTSAVLDPDSTVHASQLPDNWFENLSQSENSKLLQEAVKSTKNKQNEEHADSDRASAATESESEHEFQKKRANLRFVRKPNNKINKSNAFLKALEKTTDSHTRNLTRNQMLEGNESESTHDDSKTIMKIRPKFTRRAKNDTNNFDKALESDSASERPSEVSRRSLRSSKRISEANEDFATPKKQQRLRRSLAEKIVEVSLGNKTVENLQSKSVNITAESSVRELRNRSVTVPSKSSTPAKSTGKQNSSKRVSVEQSPDVSSSSPEVKKQRRQLFSQGNKSAADKSKGEKSAFEAALNSANDTQEDEAPLTEAVNTTRRDQVNDIHEDNNDEDEDEDDDSDSSSIPKNIRRTRSRSLFERKSDQISDVSTSKRKSQSPKDPLALDESTASDKQGESQEEAESSDEEDIYNAIADKSQEQENSNKSQADESHKSKQGGSQEEVESSDEEDIYNAMVDKSKVQQEKSNGSQADESQKSNVESSDDEDMIDGDATISKQSERDKTESARLEVSSVESSDGEDMINMSSSKAEQKKANASNKSKRTSDRINKSRASTSTSIGHKDDEVPTSPELSNRKSRSRLFQRKSASKGGNAFDDISFNESSAVNDKSKEMEIEDTPKLSQQSSKVINKSQKNQSINASKNNSSSRENSKNDSKADVSEDETSTIPKNIRRTRSRLFQKSKADDDDNAFEDVLEADKVPENRSALSQKSRTLNKTTNNKSASAIRDAPSQRSILEAVKNKPRIVLDKIIRPADSALVDSSEENQENRQPNKRNSVTIKEKSVGKLPEINAPTDQRSVETSSEGTPATPKIASTPFPTPSVPTKVLPSKRVSSKPSPVKSVQNSTFDDLLHTPNPAQSTLNPHGRPLTRITQFSYATPFSDVEERTPIADPAPATVADEVVAPKNATTIPSAPAGDQNDDIDVTGESDVSDYPLLTRQLDEIPNDKEKTTFEEQEEVPVVSQSPKKKAQHFLKEQNVGNNNETESTIDWDKARKHTDAIKLMVDAQRRQAEEARKKRELEKQRVDAKVKRLQAQREAEAKRKNRKPIDKAFLVDGKVYKQPKLPRPKPWATDKLYKYLWKCLEPKYGVRARVKSEEFVIQLSDFATRISKRKKFENYSGELDELMMTMAKLGIIETRYDFHRFVSDFLPSSFREKVNPIAQPGNGRNIPYDPELLNRPLLISRARENDTDES